MRERETPEWQRSGAKDENETGNDNGNNGKDFAYMKPEVELMDALSPMSRNTWTAERILQIVSDTSDPQVITRQVLNISFR